MHRIRAQLFSHNNSPNCGKMNDECAPRRATRMSAQRRFHTQNTCIVRGDERWMRPCRSTRAGTEAPPLPNSIKPRGVPLPHRGCTFDSAGSASATQPTLGNNASEEATPLGVVLFLITHHYHTVPNEWFPACKLILKSTMPMA